MTLPSQELEQLLQNPTKPDENPLLFEVEALAMFLGSYCTESQPLSSGLGQHPNKALLWGVMETTRHDPLAATVLTFVCGPDQTFTQKTKGVKDWWKTHFCNTNRQSCFHLAIASIS
ncbi:hypothetical protein BJV74DRAFT_800163 [Russula compacta]|nr:hypothetical protein BJV74DRAFT_800163 [Russula compacta]